MRELVDALIEIDRHIDALVAARSAVSSTGYSGCFLVADGFDIPMRDAYKARRAIIESLTGIKYEE
jgi:hypothetical protein